MELQTISWDNSSIYKNFDDPKISDDIKFIERSIGTLEKQSSAFNSATKAVDRELVCSSYDLTVQTKITLWTLAVFASTTVSVDSLHQKAKDLLNQATQLFANLKKAQKSLDLYLRLVSEAELESLLQDKRLGQGRFMINYDRKFNDHLLSNAEEQLIEGLSVDGLSAWDKLYSELTGTLKVQVGNQQMGLSQAANVLFGSNREKREQAYRGINQTWQQNEIAAAAIQNSIQGWRLETARFRSQKKELHYLDQSCFEQRVSRETLETMMSVTYDSRSLGHEALNLTAKTIGTEKLAPWDLNADFPSKEEVRITFPDAMQMLYEAFDHFHPELGNFARMMVEKRWIDATPTPNRKTGAYCTSFAKTREPRVFITYDGNMKNVMTLAHEIGHAYHTWVMRDLPFIKTHYPSTLAETASIFAETLVREYLVEKAKTSEERKKILWQNVESASSLLINIPARYEFEKNLIELRKKKYVSPNEMKSLTEQAWQKWYGETLTEYNSMFWASKLHFSMSRFGFYNYPYLFGYLFSLGIYAKKNDYGSDFKGRYVDVLRDTGRMTAEELIQKHFNEDITKKEFWQKSLASVKRSINQYKELMT